MMPVLSPSSAHPAATGAAPPLLIVDADHTALATLAETLAGVGYHAFTATTGDEALAVVRERAIPLALLAGTSDAAAPLDVAARLSQEQSCATILLGERCDRESVREAATRGVVGHCRKPVELPALVPLIETALVRGDELRQYRNTVAQLELALRQGRETSMAVGVLMERMRLSRTAAYARLRERARNDRRKVVDVAAELLDACERLSAP